MSGDTRIAKTSADGGLELEVTFTIKGPDAEWVWTWAFLCGLDPHTVAWMACGEYSESIREDPTARKLHRAYKSYHARKGES